MLLLSLSFFLFLRHLIRPKIKKFQGCSSPSHHVFGRRKASLFTHTQHTIPMSAIQFSSRAAVAPKISLKKSSKVSVRTGVRAQAVAARKC
jgi:hypothetical protein